ncbi:MAG TPA: zinc finger domain-containing protein, partial [Allocoleopsis sp.]
SEIEVLTAETIAIHPFLCKLGLDLLDSTTTVAQVLDRFQDKRFCRRSLPALLLDQHFLCGLGNYLRSEVLFVARVPPVSRPIDCSPQQLLHLAEASIAVTVQSYQHNGITNDLQLTQTLKAQGKRRREYRHFVFNREGRPCFICGTAIVKEILAGRRLYYCPTCQMKG